MSPHASCAASARSASPIASPAVPSSPIALRVTPASGGPTSRPSAGIVNGDGAHSADHASIIEQIFVKAEAQDSQDLSSSLLVSMEVGNLPQRDGEKCNIEFSFAVGVDSVKDIISEMQEELNLDLGAEDAVIIENKIDIELRRCASLPLVVAAQGPPPGVHDLPGTW